MICQEVNLHLLSLKASFFLIYSVIFSSLPYISIISTQISTYEQLSIIFACSAIASTVWPIVIGFVADKLGNYSSTIIVATLVTGFVHLPLLWLIPEENFITSDDLSNLTDYDSLLNYSSNYNASESVPFPESNTSFSLLLIIRLLGFMGMDTALSLLDASGLAMVKRYHGDFGLQKMWSMLSIVVVPPICGLAVDGFSATIGRKDYSVALYISAALALVLVPILCKMKIEVEKNNHSLLTTAKHVIGMVDVDVFLLVQVVLGCCMGFHVMYLSVYVTKELQGSGLLNGLAFGIDGASALLAVAAAKIIIGKLGETYTVTFSLLLYCIRFISFYFITNPWFLIGTELLDGFSGFLGATTGCYYCSKAAPPGMLASLNGLFAAAVHGIGRGLGMSLGSGLISEFGIRTTYLLFGISAGVAGVVYLVTHKLFLRKLEKMRLASSAKSQRKLQLHNGDSNNPDELINLRN